MIEKKKLTPLVLAGIFILMLGLSYAAVPLYDLFCRVTGFGGTTQVSNNAPKIVLDKVVSVRFDTNVNNLPWDFKAKSNVIDVKVGQVNKIEFVNAFNSGVGIITCNIMTGVNTTGIDTSVGLGTAIGGFSWGRLSGFTRGENPISIGVTGLTIDSGLTTYPSIQRRDFGLRDTGSLRKDLG